MKEIIKQKLVQIETLKQEVKELRAKNKATKAAEKEAKAKARAMKKAARIAKLEARLERMKNPYTKAARAVAKKPSKVTVLKPNEKGELVAA